MQIQKSEKQIPDSFWISDNVVSGIQMPLPSIWITEYLVQCWDTIKIPDRILYTKCPKRLEMSKIWTLFKYQTNLKLDSFGIIHKRRYTRRGEGVKKCQNLRDVIYELSLCAIESSD